jgi:hypothetical protein
MDDMASEQDELFYCDDWSTAVRVCGAMNESLTPGYKNHRGIEVVAYEVVTENVEE